MKDRTKKMTCENCSHREICSLKGAFFRLQAEAEKLMEDDFDKPKRENVLQGIEVVVNCLHKSPSKTYRLNSEGLGLGALQD